MTNFALISRIHGCIGITIAPIGKKSPLIVCLDTLFFTGLFHPPAVSNAISKVLIHGNYIARSIAKGIIIYPK
jgi:hypothetical protein